MIRVNLLGLPKQVKRAPVVSIEGGRVLIIFALVCALIAGAQFFRYNMLQLEDQRLTEQIQESKAEKARLENVRAEYEKLLSQKELLVKRTEIIEQLKAKQAGPSKLLNALASTVGKTETLWLTHYEQTGTKVLIEGTAMSSKAVADFLTNIKDSKAFAEMDLKETFQDSAEKEIRKFDFTLNGQLASSTPTT